MLDGVAPGSAEAIERLVIDDVPVFHAPAARRTMATLQFRVGRADEPFAAMGISHLVEHLSLYRIGRQPYHTNGFVDPLRTAFVAHGTPGELGHFLDAVVAALRDLPLERLPDEGRVLRTEAMARTLGLWDQLVWYRYGARGIGAVGMMEFGLTSVDGPAVQAWSSDRFTRSNAVVWIAGPLPDGLRLDLPDGAHHPVPAWTEVPGLTTPAWIPARLPGIALGCVVPRTSAATMGLRILTSRLEKQLRYEAGRSYEVSLAYSPLDATHGHGSIYASCLDPETESVRDTISAAVDRFASHGPTDDELAADIHEYRRRVDDPDAVLGELDRLAHSTLVGHPLDGGAEILEEMAAVTVAQARDAFADALATALMMGPLDRRPAGRTRAVWSDYPIWSRDAVTGRAFDRAARRYPWQRRTDVIVVGPDGVSFTAQTGQSSTVRYEECVGLVIDGPVRTVFGRDGFSVRIDPTQWRNGETAARLVEEAVPDHLHAHLAPLT